MIGENAQSGFGHRSSGPNPTEIQRRPLAGRYGGVERRAVSRAPALLSGKIFIDRGRASPDCVIRNLSPGGAHVRIAASIELPRAVGLLLIREGLLFDATVVWRHGDRTGLVFSGQHDLLRDPDPACRGARMLWESLRPR